MREVVIVESTKTRVSVLGRSADPELVERVSREVAAQDRRRLARLECPVRLVPRLESEEANRATVVRALPEKTCPHCHRAFVPKTVRRVFCTEKCKDDAKNARRSTMVGKASKKPKQRRKRR